MLDGRYQVLGLLGKGAAGAVLRARDLELERHVALKLLGDAGPVADPERFLEEARALGELEHPGIVRVLAAGVARGQPYMVLELIESGSLGARLDAGGPLPVPDATRLAGELLDALAFAHDRGILHRDVKPANVLLSQDGRALLADFGLAKRSGSAVRTETGLLFGTPEYMAPELLRGEPASPASDLYAWGCTLHEMVLGRPPHVGALSDVLSASLAGWSAPASVPASLAPVLRAALSKDPAARPVVATLQRLLLKGEGPEGTAATRVVAAGGALRAPPTAGPAPASGRARLLGVLAACVGLGAAFGLVGSGGPPAPTPAPARPTPAHPGLAEAWSSRLEGLDVEAWVAAVQARVYDDYGSDVLKFEPYPHAMGRLRGGQVVDTVDLGVLREADPPWVREFAAQRSALREHLQDAAVPLLERLDLLRGLQRLGHLDAFYRAWSLPAPYGADEVVRALVPWSMTAWGEESGGGRLLFQWTEPQDRRFPSLQPEEMEPSPLEVVMIGRRIAESEGKWKSADHVRITARLELADAEAARPAALVVKIAGHVVPNVLWVRVDDLLLAVPADPAFDADGQWRVQDPLWVRLRVPLPAGLLAPGANLVTLRVMPLPGLTRWGGLLVERLELELGA